jgi:NAD+ diphosphatase
MATPPSQPNILAGAYLDRVSHWRKDDASIEAALRDPQALFIPVWKTRSLVAVTETSSSARFIAGARELGDVTREQVILLGRFHDRVCFAIELESEEPPVIAPGAEFHDLRMIAGELPADEAGVLAYARAMLHWRERHRYCGRCGSPTRPVQGGHVLECIDSVCGNQQFPRIDPAVIVLVTDGERALLGRQAAWPPGRYSTIAGFVEPGESLEDAVAREVLEETGVEVDRIDYHSSQPWPFPSSLMLGFTASARSSDILCTDDELEDVRWLTRAQIAAGEVSLPTTHSISFRLIEDWYDAGATVPLRAEPNVRLWQPPRRTG